MTKNGDSAKYLVWKNQLTLDIKFVSKEILKHWPLNYKDSFYFCGKCEFTNSCENIFIPNSYETSYADEHSVNKFRVPKKLYWSSQWTHNLATEPLGSNHRTVTLVDILQPLLSRFFLFFPSYTHIELWLFSLKVDYVTSKLRPV
jgi:hypothetical protein